MFNFVNKAVTLAFWLIAFYLWQQDVTGLLAWIPGIALIVAAVHCIEVAYFWQTQREKSRWPVMDALLVLVFGVFHLHQFMRPRKRAAGLA